MRVKFDRIEWLGHRRRWAKSQRFRWLLPRASLGPMDLRKSSHQTVAKNARKASEALLTLVERIIVRCQTRRSAGTREATMRTGQVPKIQSATNLDEQDVAIEDQLLHDLFEGRMTIQQLTK